MTVSDQDELTLLIGEDEFSAWPTIDIHLALDSFSSVDFTAPFEPRRKVFRELFRPFSFKPVELKIAAPASGGGLGAAVGLGGAQPGNPGTLFSGTLIGVDPDSEPSKSHVGVSAYSIPGVLNDCNAPAASLPVEFTGINLRDLAKAIADAYSIELDFRVDPGANFDKVKLGIDRKLFDFLAELAKQRNIVISNTPEGALLCWQSVEGTKPVARLNEDEQPVTRVRAKFSPQTYFSEITGFVTARKGRKGKKARKGSRFTELNPRLEGILRSMSFNIPDTEDGGAPAATKAKLARMFANMAAYTVDVATWRDPQGALWEPNTTVSLIAPGAMCYTETDMLIRTVDLHQDTEKSTATLGLVLPGAFSGKVPEVLPWEE